MDNISFKKVLDDGELFDQQTNYEDNFEKINQEVVPKITALESGKVDKVAGKGLSTNDFDNEYKAKIDVDIPAQLNEIEQDKAEKSDVGLLSGLLTTAKTSIVNAINELFNSKANRAQEAWITPTLLNGATGTCKYRKNEIGRVEFLGRIVIPANNVDAFIMPAAYYPESNLNLTITATDGTSISCVITVGGAFRTTNGAGKTIILATLSYAR